MTRIGPECHADVILKTSHLTYLSLSFCFSRITMRIKYSNANKEFGTGPDT